MEKFYKKIINFANTLPIGKEIGKLDFIHPGILIGETACGKSMVIPPLALIIGGYKRIIVRQPTRLASFLAMKSMEAIYGSDINVGCVNRDVNINPKAPILQITDGVLIEWLREKQIWYDELIILDEVHATSEQLEIAMGIIKHRRLNVWCLSATIDPGELADYFDLKVYYVSGINYPIYKRHLYGDLYEFLMKTYLPAMIKQRRSALVFLPTRYETEQLEAAAREAYPDRLITSYMHGGVGVEKFLPFSKKENLALPFILFSTPVSEQSITLDLDDIIIKNEQIKVVEKKGIKLQQRYPLSPNSLIQMMGRCGRLRPGNVTVITERAEYEPVDFTKLKPTAVEYALASNTPFELAILLADAQIKLSDVELITPVKYKEYEYAVGVLEERGIIHKGRLTSEGALIRDIPLEYNLAQFVATASEEIREIVIGAASFGTQSIYHLLKFYPEGIPEDVVLNRKKIWIKESDLLSKYNILRHFYKLPQEAWEIEAERLGINLYVIENALGAMNAIYDHLHLPLPSSLPSLTQELIGKFQEYVFYSKLYPPVAVNFNFRRNEYRGYVNGLPAFLDSISQVRGRRKEILFAQITRFKTQDGNWRIRLADATICPPELVKWLQADITVNNFLYRHFKPLDGKISIKGRLPKSLFKRYPKIRQFLQKHYKIYKKRKITRNFSVFIIDILRDFCKKHKICNLKSLEKYLN